MFGYSFFVRLVDAIRTPRTRSVQGLSGWREGTRVEGQLQGR